MGDRDDAPPDEVVEALRWAIVSRMQSNGTTRARGGLRALRTLPAAARWRLIGWLADGLEPTREMVEAAENAVWIGPNTFREALAAGLTAAAREAGDAE